MFVIKVIVFDQVSVSFLTFYELKSKIFKIANRVDPDEVAYNELSHLGLQCLPCSL